MEILKLAERNQQSARKVLEDTAIISAWEGIGATVHLIGSAKTGTTKDNNKNKIKNDCLKRRIITHSPLNR